MTAPQHSDALASEASPPQGLLPTAWTVVKKELLTSFRDRQVWVYTVVLPLLMYPVLFWVMLQASTVIEGRRQVREVEVALVADEGLQLKASELGAELRAVIDGAGARDEPDSDPADTPESTGSTDPESPADNGPGPAEDDEAEPTNPVVLFGLTRPWGQARAAAALALPADQAKDDADAIDAYLHMTRGPEGAVAIQLVHDSARANSVLAKRRLEGHFETLSREARAAGALELGAELGSLSSFNSGSQSTAGAKDTGAMLLSMMLPMMLIIMSVMGSFYPAVDLTAGEIERKTEETTLLLPVPRMGVQLGKLLAVAAAGGLAAVMNLTGIVLAAEHLLGMMGAGSRLEIELSLPHLALTLPLLLAFLVFVSAVLVSVASFAKTFKQGQSMLGSAQMLFLLPAIASSLPGLVLSPALAAVPVVGLSMSLRTILRGDPFGELPWGSLAVAFLAQFIAAGLALWVGLRLLDRELDSGDERTIPQRMRALLAGRDGAPK